MTYSSYRVKVPGKLMIAGEYAVLEPHQQAVVIAIDRYVTAYIEPTSQNQLSLPQLGLEHITWEMNDNNVEFSVSDSRLLFIQNAISVVQQLLKESSVKLRPFHLTITSELDDTSTGRKYGLGSSAAVVVAVVSAILTLHGEGKVQPELDHIFKLSAVAHLRTQGNGSGADIASSTFGGWLMFSSFQPKWVLNELRVGTKISDLIRMQWPNLSIHQITPPSDLELCVGWTEEAALTAPMIMKVQEFRSSNVEAYNQFLKESSAAVDQLIKNFEEDDCIGAISSLRLNRKAIMKLSKHADIKIETRKLKALCSIAEMYGSGKPSGAGGGDCGIAFTSENHIEELYKAWGDIGIQPLELTVSQNGPIVTELNCEPSLIEHLTCI